ncbi:MAG: GNAT family N-acetyltransferase [Patescibacteria group bacterium]
MLRCEQGTETRVKNNTTVLRPGKFEVHEPNLILKLQMARNHENMSQMIDIPPIRPEGHVSGQMFVGRQALAHLDDGVILKIIELVETLSVENKYTRSINQEEIINQIIADQTLIWLDNSDDNVFRLVGFCKVVPHKTPNGTLAELGSVIITPEYGGNGCGYEIVRQAVDQWSSDEVRVTAITNAANPANRVFCRFSPPTFAYSALENYTIHKFFSTGSLPQHIPDNLPQDLEEIKYLYIL